MSGNTTWDNFKMGNIEKAFEIDRLYANDGCNAHDAHEALIAAADVLSRLVRQPTDLALDSSECEAAIRNVNRVAGCIVEARKNGMVNPPRLELSVPKLFAKLNVAVGGKHYVSIQEHRRRATDHPTKRQVTASIHFNNSLRDFISSTADRGEDAVNDVIKKLLERLDFEDFKARHAFTGAVAAIGERIGAAS